MTFHFKSLGLVVIAALALSVLAASTASAQTAVVEGGPEVHGSDNLEGKIEMTGLAGVACAAATYEGAIEESTVTFTPRLEGCLLSTGASVTYTHNGCVYRFTLGNLDVEHHEAPIQAVGILCPEGKQVEYHIYNSATHLTSICTVEIPAQTPTSKLTATNEGGKVRIKGEVTGITNNVSGSCATALGRPSHATAAAPASIQHVDMLVGTEPTGEPLSLVTLEE